MNRPRTPFAKNAFYRCLPAFVACILGLTPQVLLAHAVLVKSTPTANATLPAGTTDIALEFNSRVDGTRSQIYLSTANGSPKPLPLDKQPAPDTLASHVSGLESGTYTLEWRVLSVDGHITRGRIPFQVK